MNSRLRSSLILACLRPPRGQMLSLVSTVNLVLLERSRSVVRKGEQLLFSKIQRRPTRLGVPTLAESCGRISDREQNSRWCLVTTPILPKVRNRGKRRFLQICIAHRVPLFRICVSKARGGQYSDYRYFYSAERSNHAKCASSAESGEMRLEAKTRDSERTARVPAVSECESTATRIAHKSSEMRLREGPVGGVDQRSAAFALYDAVLIPGQQEVQMPSP